MIKVKKNQNINQILVNCCTAFLLVMGLLIRIDTQEILWHSSFWKASTFLVMLLDLIKIGRPINERLHCFSHNWWQPSRDINNYSFWTICQGLSWVVIRIRGHWTWQYCKWVDNNLIKLSILSKGAVMLRNRIQKR